MGVQAKSEKTLIRQLKGTSFGSLVFYIRSGCRDIDCQKSVKKVSTYLLWETWTFGRYDQVRSTSSNKLTAALVQSLSNCTRGKKYLQKRTTNHQWGKGEASHFGTSPGQTVRRCSPLFIRCILYMRCIKRLPIYEAPTYLWSAYTYIYAYIMPILTFMLYIMLTFLQLLLSCVT